MQADIWVVNPASAATDVTYDILLAEDNVPNQKLALKILVVGNRVEQEEAEGEGVKATANLNQKR